MLVVTSPDYGTVDSGDPEAPIVPALDHELVWVVAFHTEVPRFSDVQMGLASPRPSENPMVPAVAASVVSARTGEALFSDVE